MLPLPLLFFPIFLVSTFALALVTFRIPGWKSGRSVHSLHLRIPTAKRRQRYHQQRMSLSSDWIVSSLCEGDNEDASPPITRPEAEVTTQPLIPTHLFLHFDINETILLGDDAGGDSRHESTQKMLAKSAFCRKPSPSFSASFSTPTTGVLAWEKTQQLKPTHWWDGQEIGRETSMPPLYTGWKWPEHCCPYYRTAYKGHAKSFTEDGKHGQIYSPLLEACEASLLSSSSSNYSIPSRSSRDADGSSSEGKQDAKNTILPAFYETLCNLIESYEENENDDKKESQPPPFTVIFRTFGSDLSEIASVVTTFAKGEHPDYPDINFPPLCLSEDRLYQGRWKVITNANHNVDNDDTTKAAAPEVKVVYQLWTSDETELVASGDFEILELLSGKTKINQDELSPSSPSTFAIFGIRDDYAFWKANQFSPTAGKPIWVLNYDNNIPKRNIVNNFNNRKAVKEDGCTLYSHHMLFDDNIHNLPDDGIACVRKESLSGDDVANESTVGKNTENAFFFETVDGTNLDAYQGIHLVRVPTVEPVLNPQWYIQQIEKARIRLQLQLQSQLKSQSKHHNDDWRRR
jgi:hypothetical protein